MFYKLKIFICVRVDGIANISKQNKIKTIMINYMVTVLLIFKKNNL